LLHFSSSTLGCSPIPPIPGQPNEGGSMGEFIAVKLTIQFQYQMKWLLGEYPLIKKPWFINPGLTI
jgi:hypothetical protein